MGRRGAAPPRRARFVVAWSRATDRQTGKVRHIAVWVPRDGGLWGGHSQPLCMRDALREVQEWRVVPERYPGDDAAPFPPYMQRLFRLADRAERLPVCRDCVAIVTGAVATLDLIPAEET